MIDQSREALNLRISVVTASRFFRAAPTRSVHKEYAAYKTATAKHRETKEKSLIQVLAKFAEWMNKESKYGRVGRRS